MQATASKVPAPTTAGSSPLARGGMSIAAVLTGALVVYAAAALFTLVAVAISRYVGYQPYRLLIGGGGGSGPTAAIGIGLGLFLAFMWGGYTAGRMGRGAGWSNGFLVVIAAAVIFAIGLGAHILLQPGPGIHVRLRLPSGLPHISVLLPTWMAVAAAAAIGLVGGGVGGALGSRWHTKLERRALKEERESREARESFRDLREATVDPTPVTAPDYADEIIAPVQGQPTGPAVGTTTGPIPITAPVLGGAAATVVPPAPVTERDVHLDPERDRAFEPGVKGAAPIT